MLLAACALRSTWRLHLLRQRPQQLRSDSAPHRVAEGLSQKRGIVTAAPRAGMAFIHGAAKRISSEGSEDGLPSVCRLVAGAELTLCTLSVAQPVVPAAGIVIPIAARRGSRISQVTMQNTAAATVAMDVAEPGENFGSFTGYDSGTGAGVNTASSRPASVQMQMLMDGLDNEGKDLPATASGDTCAWQQTSDPACSTSALQNSGEDGRCNDEQFTYDLDVFFDELD